MLKIETKQKYQHKVMALETLASHHERFTCKRGKFQAPETCEVCRAWIHALRIVQM